MRVIVTAEGSDLSASASPRFGRCQTFVLVETETMEYEALPNPALSASGGAGVQAAQFVVEQGVQAVLTGNLGPNAAEVLQAANIPVHLNGEATVRASIEAFKAGRLPVARGANVGAHAGMGMGRGRRQRQSATPAPAREAEIAALKNMAADLRRQLAEIADRIEKLEED
jgi:predicted Fe-Mo cluster-binding NifX family protein